MMYIIPYKMQCQDGRGLSSPNRRVRNDDWARIMGGLSSDYPRIEAIRGFFAHILNSDLWWCWRVTPLAPRFVLDVSWESFLVAGAIFGEVGVSLFVAGAACWEILRESRSAKCCIIPYKVRRQDGRGKLFEAAGARWWFYPWAMVGLSSDHARMITSPPRRITATERLKAGPTKKRFGHRTGSSPCGHSIGIFFSLVLIFFHAFHLKLPPQARPGTACALFLFYVYISFWFVWECVLCVCVCLHLPLCFFFAPLLRRIHCDVPPNWNHRVPSGTRSSLLLRTGQPHTRPSFVAQAGSKDILNAPEVEAFSAFAPAVTGDPLKGNDAQAQRIQKMPWQFQAPHVESSTCCCESGQLGIQVSSTALTCVRHTCVKHRFNRTRRPGLANTRFMWKQVAWPCGFDKSNLCPPSCPPVASVTKPQ